ncbi:MAG TPA: DNA repair protein RecO [Anaeromyxobacteraceae bacterium]|nr:DNA repair protein RecO [Anaeromyxobacteraceae bacterium]
MPRSAKLLAVVLRTVDYGERDRVVTLLTRERGKLSAFARGARSSRRRFGGALEPFTLLAVELRERGGDLWSLDEASVERGHGAVRSDLVRIACASYAVELAREMVRDAEPHEELFDALLAYLGRLEAGPARPWDLRRLELEVLRSAGLLPSLDDCARCGSAAGDGPVLFDASQGGVLCESCASTAGAGSRPASAEVLLALRRLARGEEPESGDAAAGQARALLGACLDLQLGRRLPSRTFLDELGPLLRDPPGSG